MKILLVEDSPTLRYTMHNFIRQAGHEAILAASGEEALQLIESDPVDLVIMDVEMPGLDGFETTRLIREFFGQRWVPIIFITGMSDEASYQKGIEAGGDDYMIKPVSPIILKAKLRAFERIVEMQAEMQQLNQELQALSQRDGLTGLFNRRTYEEKAANQWAISSRARESLAILMMDVDHFKDYNDHYGHQAGDDCLKAVARAMADTLHRPADLLARYGGEEFIALLPDTDVRGAALVAETLRSEVESLGIPHARSSAADVVTISVGVAVTEYTTGITPVDLVREADEALYIAKAQGRNYVKLKQVSPHKTLLILDANPVSASRSSAALREEFNIVTAASVDECLEIAHRIHPDLILLSSSNTRADLVSIRNDLQDNPHMARAPVLLRGRDLLADGAELLNEIKRYLNQKRSPSSKPSKEEA